MEKIIKSIFERWTPRKDQLPEWDKMDWNPNPFNTGSELQIQSKYIWMRMFKVETLV